jgi:hypothetical protein
MFTIFTPHLLLVSLVGQIDEGKRAAFEGRGGRARPAWVAWRGTDLGIGEVGEAAEGEDKSEGHEDSKELEGDLHERDFLLPEGEKD